MSPVVSIFVIFNFTFSLLSLETIENWRRESRISSSSLVQGCSSRNASVPFRQRDREEGKGVQWPQSSRWKAVRKRSQLTFSWLLGKYTPRAVVVSVCIRVTGARPRATCVSAAIRPAEFRF